MKTKNQTFADLQKFIYDFEKQSETSKGSITDIGSQFSNKFFQEFTSNQGIQFKLVLLYTPKRNDEVMRLNYTLMSSVRIILAAIRLPKTL